MPHFIASVRIKNFRSIVDQTVLLRGEALSIFVGRNDVGKSNVLKALNLFFNGETDAGTPFRFEHDYSYAAGTGKGKAKEVLVELIVEPPSRLSNAKPVRWIKTWRSDNLEVETRFAFSDGGPIGARSGIYQWVRKLKYRYVPAEKGSAYFPQLMSELHDVLNEVHAIEFNESAFGFVGEIQNISKDFASELQELIGLPSRIQAPSDFRTLFSNLDFGENSDGYTYHLKRRGDGIRAWHIPIILKVMAKKEQEASQSGRVNPDTVWGFEEPENNLELSNAFKVARQIYDFSQDIQILLTTHSPAFYALAEEGNSRAKAYHLIKDGTRTTRIMHGDLSELDKEMGVLELITPYVKEANEERERLELAIDELTEKTISKPIVILSEDENSELLEVLVRSSGVTDYEVLSYEGCGNLGAAFNLARIVRKKAPDSHIIVHRDRDYLSDCDISKLEEMASRANCTLFMTMGTDVETHFLTVDYISSIGNISRKRAKEYLEMATKNTRRKSLDKFSGAVINTNQRPSQNWTYTKLEREYDSDPDRYRHGKTVLKALKSVFHKKRGKPLKIGEERECLSVPEIAELG